MAPGPRKKNSKRGGDIAVDTKKNVKVITDQSGREIKGNSYKANHETLLDEGYNNQALANNWDRYDEPIQDPHADTMRGEDFAVLSSYCGGSESQLQLQEEREWEENVNDKSVVIDLQDLMKAVKSIPFHKQIDVPSDIFSKDQLSKFVSSAENFSEPSKPKPDSLPVVLSDKKFVKEAETLNADTSIIESYEVEEIEVDAPTKMVILEEKTESIIESLASCLSLKDAIPEKNNIEVKVENEKHSSTVPDELDFLLSLSASVKTTKQEEKSIKKQTNVDDWLNSILDD